MEYDRLIKIVDLWMRGMDISTDDFKTARCKDGKLRFVNDIYNNSFKYFCDRYEQVIEACINLDRDRQ